MTKTKHILVPEHTKLTAKEREELFKQYSTSLRDLPKIMKADPAIAHLNVEEGDVIMITRSSPTAGKTVFYRGVISE